jgi:hypothetical protein
LTQAKTRSYEPSAINCHLSENTEGRGHNDEHGFSNTVVLMGTQRVGFIDPAESLEGVGDSPGELGHRCQSRRCSGEIDVAFRRAGTARAGETPTPCPHPRVGKDLPAALGGDDTATRRAEVCRIRAEPESTVGDGDEDAAPVR